MSTDNLQHLSGTSASPAHIGDEMAKKLVAATEKGTEPVQMTFSLAAEAGNERQLSIQVQDRNGDDLAEVVRLDLRLYDAAMVESLVAASRLDAVTDNGSAVTTDERPGLVLDTESDGSALVDIVDVSTSLTGDLNLTIEPLDREGSKRFVVATFA